MFVRILPIVVIAVALVVYFAGAETVALVLLVAGVGSMIVLNVLRRESAPPPELDADQQEALRAERDRSGEVAAVRLVRRQHPGVSLADAVRLVRELGPAGPGRPPSGPEGS